jgi:hypothetical protein
MRIALAIALLTASCAVARPQGSAHYGPVSGESIITFGGSLSKLDPDSGGDITTSTNQAGFGYFLTDEHEVGGQLLLFRLEGSGFEAESSQFAPYYNFNYRQSSRTWFYFGPHLGVVRTETRGTNFKDDDTSASFGVHGGIRQWLTPRTSYFFEPRYTTSSDFDEFAFLFGLNFSL